MKTLRQIRFILLLLFFFALTTFFYNGYLLAHSSSPSLNSSNFLINTKNKEVEKGALISFFYMGKDKFIYKTGDSFTKIVACMPNEYLEVENLNYYCNGKLIGKASKYDMNMKPIENFKFKGQIPEGYFFALGEHEYSYDSKYFGLVPFSSIQGRATALF